MDLAVDTDHQGRQRRFTCMAGMAFAAHVVNEVTPRLKRYLKVLAFPLTAFKVYLEGDLPTLHVVHEGKICRAKLAIVANGQYYGGEFRTADDAALTTGRFEVVIVERVDRKSTRLNSSHANISYAVFCLKKKKVTLSHTTL